MLMRGAIAGRWINHFMAIAALNLLPVLAKSLNSRLHCSAEYESPVRGSSCVSSGIHDNDDSAGNICIFVRVEKKYKTWEKYSEWAMLWWIS